MAARDVFDTDKDGAGVATAGFADRYAGCGLDALATVWLVVDG